MHKEYTNNTFKFKPHLFREKLEEISIGRTVQDCIDKIDEKYSRELLVAKIDCNIVDPADYSIVIVGNQELYIFFLPGKGGGDKKNVFATIAMIALTAFTAGSSAAWGAKFIGHAGRSARFLGALLGAGATYVGSMIINSIFPPASTATDNPTSDSAESAILSIQGAQNQLKPYAPAICLYGTHKVVPPFAAPPYTVNFGDNSYLYLLFDCGVGQVEINDMKFGEDKFLNSYSDVQISTHTDLHAGGKLNIYTNAVHQEPYSIAITKQNGAIIITTQEDTDEANFDIAFQSGLVSFDDRGNRGNQKVDFTVEYKKSSDSTWRSVSDISHFSSSSETAIIADFNGGHRLYLPSIQPENMLRVPYQGSVHEVYYAHTAYYKYGWKKGSTEFYSTVTYSEAGNTIYSDHWDNPHAYIGNTVIIGGERYSIVSKETVHYSYGGVKPYPGAIKFTIDPPLKADVEVSSYDHLVNFDRNTSGFEDTIPMYKYPNSTDSIVTTNSRFLETAKSHTPNSGHYLNSYPISFGTMNSSAPVEQSALFSVTRRTAQNFSVGLNLSFDSRDQYDIRITRLTDDNFNSEGEVLNDRLSNGSTLSVLRSITHTDPLNLDHQRTILEMKIKATDQLSGVVDDFNFIGSRHLPIYNGSTWSPLTKTSNPAWIIYQILTGAETPRPIAPSRVDLTSFHTFATYCDQDLDGLPKYTANILIDYQTTVKELINNIASTARATITVVDGKYAILIDREKTRMALVTPRNSWDFTSTRSFLEKPHALKTTFVDAESDYKVKELMVYNDGYDINNATEIQDFNTYATTNHKQAWSTGRYLLAQGLHRSVVSSFKMDIENIVFTRGDMFEFQNDTIRAGGTSARLDLVGFGNNGTWTHLYLDDDIQGSPNAVIMRLHDGMILNSSCTQIEARVLEVPVELLGLRKGDLVVYGEVDSVTKQYIVKSVKPSADLTATIECVDYAPSIFTSDEGEIPDYVPALTYVENIAPKAVTGLSYQQNVQYKDRHPYITVSLNWQKGKGGYASGYEIYSLGEANWELIDTVQNSPYSLINLVRQDKLTLEDENLVIKVLPVSTTGIKASLDDATEVAINVYKDTLAPNAPTAVTHSIVEGKLEIRWAQQQEVDLDHFEIWRGHIEAGQYYHTSELLTVVDYKTYSVVVDPVDDFYWVKAVDTSGNASAPTQFQFTPQPPVITSVKLEVDTKDIFVAIEVNMHLLPFEKVVCYQNNIDQPILETKLLVFNLKNIYEEEVTLNFVVINTLEMASSVYAVDFVVKPLPEYDFLTHNSFFTFESENAEYNDDNGICYEMPENESRTLTDIATIATSRMDMSNKGMDNTIKTGAMSSVHIYVKTKYLLDARVEYSFAVDDIDNTIMSSQVTAYHDVASLSQPPYIDYLDPEPVFTMPTESKVVVYTKDCAALGIKTTFNQKTYGQTVSMCLGTFRVFGKRVKETELAQVSASDVDGTKVLYENIYLSPTVGISTSPLEITLYNPATGDYYEIWSSDQTSFTIKVFDSSQQRKDASLIYTKTGYWTSRPQF